MGYFLRRTRRPDVLDPRSMRRTFWTRSASSCASRLLRKNHCPQHRDYKVYRIASKYGHMVRITPPYHPELQVIEKIWAAIKNPIAMDPIRNKKDMQARVLQSRDAHVSGELWVKVRNHVLKQEDEYWAMVPPEEHSAMAAAAPIPERCDSDDD